MKLSHISNLLARSFLVFIIAWLWISFYIRGFLLILLLSAAVTVAFNYVVSLIYKKRNKLKTITKQEREHMHLITLQLKFMTKTQVQALFKKCIPSAKVHSLFHTTPTEQDIIKCVKATQKTSKTLIAAETFPPPVSAFARSLDAHIILLDAEAVYTQILAPTQTFPEVTIQTKKKTPRKTLAEIKSMIFNRTRTKSYVITGAVILFSSLIVRLHIYYIIIATIVFALALTSYFSPKSPKNLFD
jgi:hypothetical protein